MLNASTLNSTTLNGAATAPPDDYDWEKLAPVERQVIYQVSVGAVVVPVSSFQSTMRLTGQSFLQLVVPNGDVYIDDLTLEKGNPMTVEKGYRYADGSTSPLETIATAPFEILRSDDGPRGMTLSLSGYGTGVTGGDRTRELRGVTYRSISEARRRVRSDVDLFLRPGDTALDTDGVEFTVGVIQHFVDARNEAMEVVQDG